MKLKSRQKQTKSKCSSRASICITHTMNEMWPVYSPMKLLLFKVERRRDSNCNHFLRNAVVPITTLFTVNDNTLMCNSQTNQDIDGPMSINHDLSSHDHHWSICHVILSFPQETSSQPRSYMTEYIYGAANACFAQIYYQSRTRPTSRRWVHYKGIYCNWCRSIRG